MIRSFLAIELPKAILKKIEEVQGDLRSCRADVRWVSPERIHLTLKFFGNIEEARIEPILKAIENAVHNTPVFSLGAKGIGAFPHWKNPRVIWMGLIDGKGVLVPFQKELETELEKIGFEPEGRAFQPHLTLGRANSSRGKEELIWRVERYREENFGDLVVERVILFKSDLKPTGPIYTALREVRLGGQ
ncbi:MAG: 2'-5' RNA ligase [Deltaproteobacteria bacterium RBG_16_48_10]|nr:MAG: 2'-5' RNA ligase [Deltaproteobacteria bacterium RBG_16_48_10]